MAENIRPSQISLKRLALALIHKGTKNSRFVHDDEWTYDGRTYSYKNEIYPWARYEFDDLYPQSIPDEEFTQSFIRNIYRDPLRARVAGNQPKQPIIAKLPETLPTTTQPAPASNIPPPPVITKLEKPPPAPLQAKETEEAKLAAEQEAKEGQTIPQAEQITQPIRRSFQLPKMPAGLRSAALTAGSNLGIVFRKYVGQHATFGRAVAIAGGLAAGVATGGNPLAIAAGAGAGLLGSSYLSSPEGKAFMQNLGRGNVNSRGSSPLRLPKKSSLKFLKLLLVGGGLSFILLAVVGGFLAPFGGPITPTGETAHLPGSVGIGNTAPSVRIANSVSKLSCSTSMSAQEINNYFDKNGYYNFFGTGQAFYNTAQTYKINPAFIIAIGIQESSLGNVYKGKPSEGSKNAFGLMQNSSLMKLNSWEEGAGVTFKTVNSFNCLTIECIGQKYAPIGASNDPTNLNQNWSAGVISNFNSIPQRSCISTTVADIKPDKPSGWPATGKIVQGPFGGFSHRGQNAIDIINPAAKTPVYSTLNGVVTEILHNDPSPTIGYGVRVIITNKLSGAQVLFGHLIPRSNSHLKQDQVINKGDFIGFMDNTGFSTGTHVHYEIRGSIQNESFGQFVPGGNIGNDTIIRFIDNPGDLVTP